MTGLNPSQQAIADRTEGIIVVDAGPGTGKTYTVVGRYLNIVKKRDVKGRDVVLLTFTNNAAREMEDRIRSQTVGKVPPDVEDKLKSIRVSTFDAFCLATVLDSPQSLSDFLGIRETLTHGARTVEKDSLNKIYFRQVLDRFLTGHAAEYPDAAAVASEHADALYQVIAKLMSRGIVPLRRGWFGGHDGRDLIGDLPAVREAVSELPSVKKKDPLQCPLPNPEQYRDSLLAAGFDLSGTDLFPNSLRTAAADEDRTPLLALVHDVYFEFIRRSIADDRLTFGLTACFAFLILYSDDTARRRLSCRYLMIDEFQDTNANQLMIGLMLLTEPNLCVVGDWKQGIYSFRNATVENILYFRERTAALRKFLNEDRPADRRRVPYALGEITELPLVENYRSSQLIIDAAYAALYIPTRSDEELDRATLDGLVTRITSARPAIGTATALECVSCPDSDSELDEVLRTVIGYVQHNQICEPDGTFRPARFADIAVLCRKTATCRALYDRCGTCGVPAFLQGDMEIMRTREGKLVLAWLKYVNNDFDRWGIVPILADLGYPAADIRNMIAPPDESRRLPIPDEVTRQRKALRQKRRRITDLVSSIFAFYGLNNDVTQAINTVLSSSHRNSLLTISDLINLIENDIATDTRYTVDGLPDRDAITIQTVHSSKGLEYPIVIIPALDRGSFPNTRGDTDVYQFQPVTGLRCRRAVVHFAGQEQSVQPSWQTALVNLAFPPDRSEERRLLFVGISRAKQYVTLIAGSKPSTFFKYYAEEGGYPVRKAGTVPPHCPRLSELNQTTPVPVVPAFASRRRSLGVHDILRFGDEQENAGSGDEVCGKGMEYGTQIHLLAQKMAEGYEPTDREKTDYPQLTRVAAVLADINARHPDLICPEIECSLPVDGQNVTLRGIIDLLVVFPDHVEIHDWKTDVEDRFASEYRLQLSVYAHAAAGFYPNHPPVTCHLQWLTRETTETFTPLPPAAIAERTGEILAATDPAGRA